MLRLLIVLVLSAPLLAQEIRPVHNTSFVPSDDEKILALVEEAQQAAGRKQYDSAADLLQDLRGSANAGVAKEALLQRGEAEQNSDTREAMVRSLEVLKVRFPN